MKIIKNGPRSLIRLFLFGSVIIYNTLSVGCFYNEVLLNYIWICFLGYPYTTPGLSDA